VTKTLETEEAGNGLYTVAVDKESRLGLSARIHGVQNAAFFGPHRATTDFQVASKHMASFGQSGKI